MGKPLDELLDELSKKYGRSTRQIERYISQYSTLMNEPYIETPHKSKIRKLATALPEKICFPSPWNHYNFGIGTWGDLPVDFRPGTYSLTGIGELIIDKDRQVSVSNPDLNLGTAEPHLVEALLSHLRTSKKPQFLELVGDNGQLNKLSNRIREYSQSIMLFLKIIADETMELGTQVHYKDEARPGLLRWFILTIWNDAIQQAAGHPWINDSWYQTPESIAGTDLWQLRCGSYGIAVANTIKTLKKYENWHKKLRIKYSAHPLAKDVYERANEMTNLVVDIRQRLREFSDMEHLPGRCDLC